MQPGEITNRRSTIWGVVAAGATMLVLMIAVSQLVIRFCPGGANCEDTALRLYALGLLPSVAGAVAVGFIARDIAGRSKGPTA